jgi:hypothetical protein
MIMNETIDKSDGRMGGTVFMGGMPGMNHD